MFIKLSIWLVLNYGLGDSGGLGLWDWGLGVGGLLVGWGLLGLYWLVGVGGGEK